MILLANSLLHPFQLTFVSTAAGGEKTKGNTDLEVASTYCMPASTPLYLTAVGISSMVWSDGRSRFAVTGHIDIGGTAP